MKIDVASPDNAAPPIAGPVPTVDHAADTTAELDMPVSDMPVSTLREKVGAWWGLQSLARRFAAVASIVILLGMTFIGSWVTEKIAKGVTDNSAVAATLYMDAFVAPLVQELRNSGELSAAHRARLDEIMGHRDIRDNITAIKIWKNDGVIAYSNHHDIIGKSFAQTSHLKEAWTGTVAADLDGHSHEDDIHVDEATNKPLLEIYAPIRETGSNRIIAVSEFYVRAEQLLQELRTARLQSWGVVALSGLVMMTLLYLIVLSGSRTIARQQYALRLRAAQNAALHKKIKKAYWRADRLNEQFLRRLGADLHDGPAQLIGFSLMSLDDLPFDLKRIEEDPGEEGPEPIRKALEAALLDIRNLSRGLMLPELDGMSLSEAIRLIVRAHEERTSTKVGMELSEERIEAPQEVKICVSRFVQEALSNAFKHAAGHGQMVSVSYGEGTVTVKVSDRGPGIPLEMVERNGANRLGLIGIRDRVDTLSGSFQMANLPEGGTVVAISLPFAPNTKVTHD